MLKEDDNTILISSKDILLSIKKSEGNFTIKELKTNENVMSTAAPLKIDSTKFYLNLTSSPKEYYYGGGVQNGRFCHKGHIIKIKNENSWTDGGVASPTPFFWSTNGSGIMFHTFNKGIYDFDSKS